MDDNNTIHVLNRLYKTHCRSLPTYLSFARPWALRGDERAKDTLAHIVDDQKSLVDRIGAFILENKGQIDSGEFPIQYTAYNDLSFDYLVKKMIASQKLDTAAIGECVDRLARLPAAKALAEECLGAAKGHLDTLVELTMPSR